MTNRVGGAQAFDRAALDTSDPSAQPLQRSYAFGGAMYAWPFHCGVAAYIQENFALHPQARLFGTSSGSLAASLLACGVDIRKDGIYAALESTDAHVGHVGPYLKPAVLQESLKLFTDALPADAHERANDRLVLTLTQLPSLALRTVTRFKNRQALVEALLGTMSLPGHTVALAYRTRELNMGWVLDGGLRSAPVLDSRSAWSTVRVASFRKNLRVPGSVFNADIHPTRRVPLRMRFLVASRSVRMHWFDHGVECAQRYFTALPKT